MEEEKEQQPNKVLIHPEREEIIKRLLSGDSVKAVERWLKEKHPRKKRLWISYMTLQKFRKEHLDVSGAALEEIKAIKREQNLESEELEAKMIVATSSAYQNKLKEIVNNELDSNRKILEMMKLIGSRIEHYFNLLDLNKGKSTLREDKMLIDLLNTQKGFIQDWKRYVEGAADKRVDHNINVTVVNEQITVLKNIIFEVLLDMDPDLIPIFVDKLNDRMLSTQYGSKTYESYQENTYRQLDILDADDE